MVIIYAMIFDGKICAVCSTYKNRSDFCNNNDSPDGLDLVCKECCLGHKPPKRRTFRYFVNSCWNKLQRRTINGAHPVNNSFNKGYFKKKIKLEMTRKEFVQ